MLKERRITLKGNDGQERAYILKYDLERRHSIEGECGGKGLWDAIYQGRIIDQAAILAGGLQWKEPNLTKERMLKRMNAHAAAGGDIDLVLRHALWCCIENGVLKVKNRDAVMELMPDPLVQEEAAAQEAEGNDGARGKDVEPVKAADGY